MPVIVECHFTSGHGPRQRHFPVLRRSPGIRAKDDYARVGQSWITHCLGIEAGVLEPEVVREPPEPSRGFWFQRRRVMLYTIAVILLILWLLGFVSGYTIGAFIHVLLVVAIVLFLVGLLSGRRVV